MTDIGRAEQHRRAREWLRIDFEDLERTAAFEAAKHALSPQRTDDIHALIAIGEFAWVRTMLHATQPPAAFLRAFGAYFVATADDGVARDSWERVVKRLASVDQALEAATLGNLAIAAEAIGDRARAADLNELVRSASGPPPEAAGPITQTVYGTLGYLPDAPKGRLLLRPDIEPAWQHLSVHNLHIGDALINLDYARQDSTMEFTFSQIAGAYPIRLIFEPILSVPVRQAFVDAAPASLDFRPFGERFIIPVQIMLDERRTVRFE